MYALSFFFFLKNFFWVVFVFLCFAFFSKFVYFSVFFFSFFLVKFKKFIVKKNSSFNNLKIGFFFFSYMNKHFFFRSSFVVHLNTHIQ